MIPVTDLGLVYSGRSKDGYCFFPSKKDLIAVHNSLLNKRVFSFYERITG